MSTFIHTLHSDFENFLKKHKREHIDINQRMRDLEQRLSNEEPKNSEIRNAVEHFATILSCLVEFCNIE